MFKKKIKLRAYTHENDFFLNDKPTYNKPDPVEWMRIMRTTNKQYNPEHDYWFDVPTAKLCPGINNYLSRGIKLKAWTTIRFRVNPDGFVLHLRGTEYQGSDPVIVQHTPDQYEHLYQKNKTALKLISPWSFVCDQKVDFLFTESHYSTQVLRENNLLIAPAIIDYKYQHSTNVHIIADIKKEPYEITIPYGTPLATFYPLSEKEIDFKCELVSKEQYTKISTHLPRCPFHRYSQHIKNLNG